MFKLLQYFSLAAGVAVLAVTGLVVYGFYEHEISQLVASAERQNVSVARAISNALGPELRRLEQLRNDPDLPASAEVKALHQAIRRIARGLPVVGVRFYALDGYTLYSSESSQIGEDKRENPGFQAAAVQGRAASKLSHRDRFSAFSELVTNRELVETYIPILEAGEGTVEAVFELYMDVTSLTRRIDQDALLLGTSLTVAFAVLYGALFIIVRHADRILSRQYRSLAESREQVREKNALLEREVVQRLQAEQALQQAHDRLEEKVRQRTSELAQAVEHLEAEIAVRRQAEERLRMLSTAVEQSPASVTITDPTGLVLYANPKFLEVSGYAADEVLGTGSDLLKSGEMPQDVYKEFKEAVREGREWRGELLNRKKDGSLFWETVSISPVRAPDGEVTHLVVVKEDINLRKQYEEQLVHQANYDSLTGLANRLLMLDRLTQAVARAQRQKARLALVFIDLDDFKKVNDSLGHAAGDQLLMEFSRRVQTRLEEFEPEFTGAGYTLARLGGDEFTLVLTDLSDPTISEWVANAILGTCGRPFALAGQDVFVTCSIGITLYPDDAADPYDLMRNADLAMYRAKEDGPGSFRFFTQEFNDIAVERLRLEAALRYAIERGELYLHYQPIVDNRSGRVVGAEAVLRWDCAQFGSVAPDRFIPIAEGTGLILGIGRWVLATGLRDYPTLARQAGTGDFYLALNVSSRQLREPGFAAAVQQLLTSSGRRMEQIRFEITESQMLEGAGHTQQNLDALSQAGARFCIDDFGTGYSSLRYLKQVPIDTLKIDRSFVAGVTSNPDDAGLVRSISAIAHSLGIKVIAEGVETPEQLLFVAAVGCQYSQGWYTGKAVRVTEFNTTGSRTGTAARIESTGINCEPGRQ